MAILQKKIEEENLEIPAEALNYIANQIQSNIRELEGALTRLLAYSKLQGKPITTELAAEALKDIIQVPKSKNLDSRYSKVVGHYYNVRIEDFSAKKRTKSIAYPRQIAMYLSRELTDFSLPKLVRNLEDAIILQLFTHTKKFRMILRRIQFSNKKSKI